MHFDGCFLWKLYGNDSGARIHRKSLIYKNKRIVHLKYIETLMQADDVNVDDINFLSFFAYFSQR